MPITIEHNLPPELMKLLQIPTYAPTSTREELFDAWEDKTDVPYDDAALSLELAAEHVIQTGSTQGCGNHGCAALNGLELKSPEMDEDPIFLLSGDAFMVAIREWEAREGREITVEEMEANNNDLNIHLLLEGAAIIRDLKLAMSSEGN